jgi:hypothetical protein
MPYFRTHKTNNTTSNSSVVSHEVQSVTRLPNVSRIFIIFPCKVHITVISSREKHVFVRSETFVSIAERYGFQTSCEQRSINGAHSFRSYCLPRAFLSVQCSWNLLKGTLVHFSGRLHLLRLGYKTAQISFHFFTCSDQRRDSLDIIWLCRKNIAAQTVRELCINFLSVNRVQLHY